MFLYQDIVSQKSSVYILSCSFLSWGLVKEVALEIANQA